MASVDTESTGFPTGMQMFDGFQINRKFSDFYITPNTVKYINNNCDSWERRLLLSTFRTFIGAENYCEHVQIPELSKGKIVDAAARDIGESVYIDILVATERKHKPLIEAITSGQISALSMGCHVSYTICTKCGNVADDETQLCKHIKYEKGSTYFDIKGRKHKVAELCGHFTDPSSVKFIEGSWVANPAFTGAVMRKVLDPEEILTPIMRERIQAAFSRPVEVSNLNVMQKAAKLAPIGIGSKAILSDHIAHLSEGPSIGTLRTPAPMSGSHKASITHNLRSKQIIKAQQDAPPPFPGEDDSQDFPGEKEVSESIGLGNKKEEVGHPFKKTIDDLYNTLVDEVTQKVKKDLSDMDKNEQVIDENRSNQSLIKSALCSPKWRDKARMVFSNIQNRKIAENILIGLILHNKGGWKSVSHSKRFSGCDILVIDYLLTKMNKKSSTAGDNRIYKTISVVGGFSSYLDVNSYLTACREVMGRIPTESEKIKLLEKGKLFDLGI
jgi:hypothetical protein